MKLVIFWGKDEPNLQDPQTIKWEDGTPATLEDYYAHSTDTCVEHLTDEGFFSVYDPSMIARTRWDFDEGHWVCEAPDEEIILDITDPLASDEDIRSELRNYRVMYKTTIERPHPQ
jgi:hypothetical protein